MEPREAALGSLRLQRRRCGFKPRPAAFPDPEEETQETWEEILQEVSKQAPRVGNWEVSSGPLFDRVDHVERHETGTLHRLPRRPIPCTEDHVRCPRDVTQEDSSCSPGEQGESVDTRGRIRNG